MFITPQISNFKEFQLEDTKPVKNLKTYVSSNNLIVGKGPESWQASVNSVKTEMQGAAAYAVVRDKVE